MFLLADKEAVSSCSGHGDGNEDGDRGSEEDMGVQSIGKGGTAGMSLNITVENGGQVIIYN